MDFIECNESRAWVKTGLAFLFADSIAAARGQLRIAGTNHCARPNPQTPGGAIEDHVAMIKQMVAPSHIWTFRAWASWAPRLAVVAQLTPCPCSQILVK